ncbi:hypothetical protein AAEX63_00815 [Luteococcus sp. H138]|uniref:hypothetical protein n=1 Tax=unclassified Luteococcus TaxID=2639923 RepID=UPI00313B0F9F
MSAGSSTPKLGRISDGAREMLFGHREVSGQETDATSDGKVGGVMVQEQPKGDPWGC